MRNIEEIIEELRSVTEWSRPNVAYEKTMELINELEEVLNPSEPEPIIKRTTEVVNIVGIEDVPETPDLSNISIDNLTIDDIKTEISEPVKKVIAKRPKVTK